MKERNYTPTFDYEDKIAESIQILKDFAGSQKENVFGAFSGGKDSCVIKELCKMANLDHVDWYYNVTGIDPPELVRFIHDYHKDVRFNKPPERFFKLLYTIGYPTRRTRWCCAKLKEWYNPPPTGIMITGIRASESVRRAAQWKTIQLHKKNHHRILNPILYWKDSDVWNFIKERKLPYCCLYDQGFKRIGCVGCPMNTKRKQQLEMYPYLKKQWWESTLKWWDTRDEDSRTKHSFASHQVWWDWYWSNDSMPVDPREEKDVLPCESLFSE